MKTNEEILEAHFGSDYYKIKERDDLQYILRAMEEYADQFKNSHKQVVMQGLLSDCCQAAITTTEIHYCKECECSCSPAVRQRSGDTVAERRDFYCWSQNNGSSKCVEVCETCKRVSGVPTRGNRD